MTKGTDCERFRREWSLDFDGQSPLSVEIAAHAEECAGCRGFLAAAEAARQALRAFPLAEADPGADLDLLSAMERSRRPCPEWRRQLRGHAAQGLSLLPAGLASCALTITIALLLEHAPAGDAGRMAAALDAEPAPPGPARKDSPPLSAWLDDPAAPFHRLREPRSEPRDSQPSVSPSDRGEAGGPVPSA